MALALVLCAVLLGCGGPCRDRDGDGRGEGCERGPDCDDANPLLVEGCDRVPPECDDMPFGHLCPCLSGSHRDCYEGAPQTQDVGLCRGGRQQCIQGGWTACIEQVLPRLELCNGSDDDCDGRLDEGAESPCGGCDASCTGGLWGGLATPFEAEAPLAVSARGELTLALEPIESEHVWVPNTGEASVSKVDAEDAIELSRYALPPSQPLRVAVDYLGDAWVGADLESGQAQLSRFAAGPDRCLDRDGDGLLTSSGPADVLEAGRDECQLLSRSFDSEDGLLRSLSIDGARDPDGGLGGHVWIGLSGGALLQLDGRDGSELQRLELPSFSPWDSAFDPWGVLWVIEQDGRIARIDPAQRPPDIDIIEVPYACYSLEAIASDTQGRLSLSGFSCEQLLRYDPASARFERVEAPGLLTTRGVGVLGGDSWVAHTAGSVSRFQHEPLSHTETFTLASDDLRPIDTLALSTDSRGALWLVSSRGGQSDRGLLTRFDPMAGAASAQLEVGFAPRALGDMTGGRRLGRFAEYGSARHVFEGCQRPELDPKAEVIIEPTRWIALHVTSIGAPEGGILVSARHAGDRDGLERAPWTELGELPGDEPPFALDFETGGLVEVRVELHAARWLGAPRVARIGLQWQCPGPD
ncbi:MAG: hypothetical protein OEZ06_14920 [Myxococcales bacterium]|nr:hypothetical protein [Myxococcales bacterium]